MIQISKDVDEKSNKIEISYLKIIQNGNNLYLYEYK